MFFLFHIILRSCEIDIFIFVFKQSLFNHQWQPCWLYQYIYILYTLYSLIFRCGGWWRSGGKLTPKSYGPWLFWMLWSWDETTPATKAKNVTWMRSASQIYLLIKSYECIHWTSTFVLLCGFVEGHRNSGKDSEEDWPWELSIWDLAPQYENHYRSKHQPTCANSWMSPTTKGFGPPKWPYIFFGGEDRKTM